MKKIIPILFLFLGLFIVFVDVLVQNSNQLLEHLQRLNQLKDSSYRYDLGIDKYKQSQIIMKVGKLKNEVQKNR